MSQAELMKEKIAEQKKLPKEILDKLNNITFINCLICIGIMTYMLAIDMLYLNEVYVVFSNSAKIAAIILIIIDIIVFEFAYRKDNVSYWIHGFELLAASIIVLCISHLYVYDNIRIFLMLVPVFFAMYYVWKVLFIHLMEMKKYENSLSDVKEILKDEEEGYLDDIEEDADYDDSEIVENVRSIEAQIKLEKEALQKAKKAKKKENK